MAFPLDYGANYDVTFPPRSCQNIEAFYDRLFVDHRKAFDSVDYMAIPVVLGYYGVPEPFVVDVMQLHHGSTAAVLTRFGHPEAFDTTSGVLQGDALSPLIPIMLVDYIHGQSLVNDDGSTLKPDKGRSHSAITLTALAYAVDVAITCESAKLTPASILFRGGRLEIECGENKSFSCRI